MVGHRLVLGDRPLLHRRDGRVHHVGVGFLPRDGLHPGDRNFARPHFGAVTGHGLEGVLRAAVGGGGCDHGRGAVATGPHTDRVPDHPGRRAKNGDGQHSTTHLALPETD